MAANRLTSPREDALRKYFRELPKAPDYRIANQWMSGGAIGALGLIFWLFATSDSGRYLLGTALVFAGLFSVLKGAYLRSRIDTAYRRALSLATPKPNEAEVDRWLQEGLDRIRFHSLDRLGLTPEECEPMELPPLKAPVLWYKPGIDLDDISAPAKGADGVARYSIYNITFLWLAKHHVGIFQCDYNLLRDVVLNEEMREFYYQDIVSVSTLEEASALTLPTGSSLTSVQEFRIVVSGDQLFKVIVGAKQIRTLTGAERVPEEADVETVVRRLRLKIKEKKLAALN